MDPLLEALEVYRSTGAGALARIEQEIVAFIGFFHAYLAAARFVFDFLM